MNWLSRTSVTLLTVHTAELEFKVVFIVGLEENISHTAAAWRIRIRWRKSAG
jgi:superfamily I DNA/RNA helicase